MPPWAVVVTIVAGSVLVLAAAIGGGMLAWRAYTRRLLLRLVVRAEAIEAAGQGLTDTVTRLATADDEALSQFAAEPESQERRALHEVATRAHMLAYELDRIALPRSFVHVTESLADAAVVIDREASRVQDPQVGLPALEALSGVDLGAVHAYVESAREQLTDVCAAHGLEDMAVYGGGLYL